MQSQSFDVWMVDLNSLCKGELDPVIIMYGVTPAKALIGWSKQSDYQTATWVTRHKEREVIDIEKVVADHKKEAMQVLLDAATKQFPGVAHFELDNSWGCTSSLNPRSEYCCFDADDVNKDDCLYCGQPVERK